MWPFKNTKWKESPAHLLLLSKFTKGRPYDYYLTVDYWDSVLKEKPGRAIDRFIKDGMLEPIDLKERINIKYKISDLKDILKENGLALSGRKNDLIERLLDKNKSIMDELTKDINIFKCSQEANIIVNNYLIKNEEGKKQAIKETTWLLEKQQFKAAMQVVGKYELSQVFQRGINMDWSDYENNSQVNILIILFKKTPNILKGINENNLTQLRIAAGLCFLWGASYPDFYLPSGYKTNILFDGCACVGMLLNHAHYISTLNGYKNSKVKYVEIMGCSNTGACNECLKIKDKKYKIDDTPELPYEKCTNINGCRCSILPVINL